MLLENKKEQDEILESVEVMEEEQVQEEVVEVATPKKKRTKKQPKKEVESNDDEEVIDLTDHIEAWKKQYKKIFKNEIDGEVIIWRRLKRGEYKEILKLEEEDQDSSILVKQERMTKATVLYPFNVDALIEENAGLATVLSEEILAKSGFAMSYTEEL